MTGHPTLARPKLPLERILPAAGLGSAGIALVVIGTFLPWVSSGGVRRNSYQMVGLLDRLDLFDNELVKALLTVWPVVGPLTLVPLILAILRCWRAAGAAAAVIGGLIVVLISTVLILVGDPSVPGVAITPIGPLTALAGGISLLTSGIILLWPVRR